jgi:hypothetical protein
MFLNLELVANQSIDAKYGSEYDTKNTTDF